jgi:hypothetical protein
MTTRSARTVSLMSFMTFFMGRAVPGTFEGSVSKGRR